MGICVTARGAEEMDVEASRTKAVRPWEARRTER
jgi:hypothetical protein